MAENASGIIWAVAGLVAVIGVGVLIGKRIISKVSFKAGPVEAKVSIEDLHKDIREVKEAVVVITSQVKNGKPTTLVERVDKIEQNQQETHRLLVWQNDTLKKIAAHVGFVSTEPGPDPREPQGDTNQ